jgi:spermidine/putrescine transport system substrate-binding protein
VSRRLPQDPVARMLARSMKPSRRQFLAGMGGAAGLAALAACAPPRPPAAVGGSAVQKLPTDVSATEKICNWANWTAYLDYDDDTKKYPTLEAFMKETGIKVAYTEDVNDNDSYFNKIAPQLRAGQDIERDIFVFTDWMANRVIQQQLAQPLELIQMPHAGNLLDKLKEVSFDPGRQHSLTWQSGFSGIGYDRKKIGRDLKSIDDLWAPDLKGKVTVLSEFRDTIGCIMLSQGTDPSGKFTQAQFDKAADEVTKRTSDGYIRRIKGNDYLQDLQSGNAVAGIVWSGDIFVLAAETKNPDWKFVLPDSGGMLWSDNMMVPITSRHRHNAEMVMDYYYRPDVAAQVAAYVNYVCPVQGAQAEMEKIDKDLAASPFIFPTADFLAKNSKVFAALNPADDQKYSAQWASVIGN